MSIFAVEYTYDPARVEEMDAVRPRHREYLGSLVEAGTNIASGPWVNEAPGALLLFRGESAEEIETLLDQDPFHQESFILSRVIRLWNPVLGQIN